MRFRAIRTLLIGLLAAGVVGCQTANRFAWWRHDNAPEDSSRLARSAAPALPSSEATPETLTASRETGGKAPTYMASAARSGELSRAGLPPSAKSVPASSAATIFGAPAASYPDTKATVATIPAPPTAAMPPMTAAPVTPPPTTPRVMAQASPYDPNAYKGSQASVATSPALLSESSLDENRYGESSPSPNRIGMAPASGMPEGPAAAPENSAPDRYSFNPSPASAAPGATPNSMSPAPDRYGLSAATLTAPTTPVQAPVAPPAASAASLAAQQAPPAVAPSPPIGAAPVTTTTVQISTPPGQYRPGGTSSYQSYGLPTQTEIASRAASPAAPPAPAPPTIVPGAPAAQPAYPAAPSSSTPGLRAY